jgi:hypothetical protein
VVLMAEYVDRDSDTWVDSNHPQYTVYVDETKAFDGEFLNWTRAECQGEYCYKWVSQADSARWLLAVTFTDQVSAAAFKVRWG